MTQDLPMTFCEIHPSSTFFGGKQISTSNILGLTANVLHRNSAKSLPAYTVKIFQDLLLPAIGCVEKLS